MSRKGNEIARALCAEIEKGGLPIDTTDWQQVRIDAAIKLARALSEKTLGAGYSEREIAKQAVELADALITELQKRGGGDE